MYKRLLSLLLSVAMLFGGGLTRCILNVSRFVRASAPAEDAESLDMLELLQNLFVLSASAEAAERVSKPDDFVINADGVLTAYHGDADIVYIPATVKSIASRVFAGKGMTTVIIPEGVTTIEGGYYSGNGAFEGCTSLKEVVLPSTLTKIGERTFYGCSLLSSIEIPDSVTELGSYAFYECTSLSHNPLGTGVTSMGDYVFAYCNGLGEVVLEEGMTTLGNNAFYEAGVTKLVVPSSLTSYSTSSFSGMENTLKELEYNVASVPVSCFDSFTALERVKLGEGVTTIEGGYYNGSGAFEYCTNLKEVVLPSTLTKIGERTFYGCSLLSSIEIPDSVTELGGYAFYNCTALSHNPLGTGVTSMGDYVFAYCNGLGEVVLEEGMTTLGNSAFYEAGVTKLVVPSSLTSYSTSAFNGMANTLKELEYHVASVPATCFAGFAALEKVTLGEGVTTLEGDHYSGYGAFEYCTNLKEVVLPSTLTKIGERVFYGCSALSSIEIPDSVTELGGYAFGGCSSLSSVSLGRGITTLTRSMFEGCPLTSIKLPDTLTTLEDYALRDTRIEYLMLPDSVTSIGRGSLPLQLKEFRWPAGVPVVRSFAFDGNTELRSVVIPEGVMKIDELAFYYCGKLETVTLPSTVEDIHEDAFLMSSGGVTLIAKPGSYAQDYAEANGMLCVLDGASLKIAGAALAACVGLTLRLHQGDFVVEKTLDGKDSMVIFGLPVGGEYVLSIVNAYGDSVLSVENFALQRGENQLAMPDEISMADVVLNVRRADQTNVTKHTEITWYEQDGSVYATGSTLTNVPVGKELTYHIKLDSQLGGAYLPPEDASCVVGNTKYLSCTLQPREMVNISGIITDANGAAIAGAAVQVSQRVDDVFCYEKAMSTDGDGAFALPVNSAAYTLTITAPGFAEKTISAQAPVDGYSHGNIQLDGVDNVVIFFEPMYQPAAAAGETAAKRVLTAEEMVVTASRADNGEALMVSLQDGVLRLAGNVKAGDAVCISIASPDGSFATYTETLMAANNMYFSPAFVQYGSVSASWTDTHNISVRLLAYDANGALVDQKSTSGRAVRSIGLAEGTYTMIVMGESDLIASPATLEGFAVAGLAEGTDYLQQTVSVSNGVIAEISFGVVPQLNLQTYYLTAPDRTKISTNQPSATLGTYVTLRANAGFQASAAGRVSNMQWVIVLPENMSYVDGSTSVTGAENVGVREQGNQLVIQYHAEDAVLRTCVMALKSGDFDIPVYFVYDLDGQQVRQYMGMIDTYAEPLMLEAPKKTSFTNIEVSGYAPAHSIVRLYDNGKEIAEHNLDIGGTWTINAELDQPYTYTTHRIQAKITLNSGSVLESETAEVLYQYTKDPVKVKEVVMQHNGSRIVFDFTDEGSSGSYSYNPSYRQFAFDVVLEARDLSLVKDVELHVFFSNGEDQKLYPTFDATRGLWHIETEFERDHMPTILTVGYNHDTPLIISMEAMRDEEAKWDNLEGLINEYGEQKLDQIDVAEFAGFDEEVLSAIDTYNEAVDNLYSYLATVEAQFSEVFSLVSMDANGNLVVNGDAGPSTIYNETANGLTPVGLLADGYEAYETSAGSVIYCKYNSSTGLYSYVDFASNTHMRISDGAIENVNRISRMLVGKQVGTSNDAIGTVCDTIKTWGSIAAGSITALSLKLEQKQKKFEEEIKKLQLDDIENGNTDFDNGPHKEDYKTLKGNVGKIKSVQPMLHIGGAVLGVVGIGLEGESISRDQTEINRVEKIMKDFVENAAVKEFGNKYKMFLRTNQGLSIIAIAAAVVALVALGAASGTALATAGAIATIVGLVVTIAGCLLSIAIKLYKKLFEKATATDTPDHSQPGKKPVPPIVDPSGYVYEGVPSNRIPNATASVYEKRWVEDMYGEAHEVIEVWDAAPYDQVNPQTTTADGTYGWDVPDGWWQVRVELAGYETYYTEWMEVPPERKDVYIGIVSKEAPQVSAVTVTQDGVDAEFSKYVRTAELEAGAFTVIIDGQTVTGTVTMVNAEENPARYGEMLVSKVRFTPAAPFAEGATVEVRISEAVTSYADVAMTEAYASTHTLPVAPDRVPGDANEDGMIDLFDALAILQYDVGWDITVNLSNSDVNADGTVDLFDALAILQYDVGWDVVLQ